MAKPSLKHQVLEKGEMIVVVVDDEGNRGPDLCPMHNYIASALKTNFNPQKNILHKRLH